MKSPSFQNLVKRSDGNGRGFFALAVFAPIFNLILIFSLLVLSFKFLQYKGWLHYADNNPEKPKNKVEFLSEGGVLDEKRVTCDHDSLRHSDDAMSEITAWEAVDVDTLRRMLRAERRRVQALIVELEEERKASAMGATEALGALLRLQSEKGAAELRFNQYKRVAEQKQEYDKQVMEGLQWIMMRQEEEKEELERKLRVCAQKLRMYATGDEILELDLNPRELNPNTETW